MMLKCFRVPRMIVLLTMSMPAAAQYVAVRDTTNH
jgi:hypothetical protein